ncbi:hypothetical protein [uncultured Sphingomonas sp.]|uniref:hypothetical protein n=1 Tax=uncultured Sphingomonas sp. TaxID=158754 RepID=UPI0035CAC5B8
MNLRFQAGDMEDGSYTIEVDVPNRLLLLELVGFWSADTALAFGRDVHAATRRIGVRPHQHLTLADLSRFSLQPQVVVGICRALIVDARLPSRRLAVVAGEGLARIQIKRVLVRDRMEVFSDRSSAMNWLLTDETAAVRRMA